MIQTKLKFISSKKELKVSYRSKWKGNREQSSRTWFQFCIGLAERLVRVLQMIQQNGFRECRNLIQNCSDKLNALVLEKALGEKNESNVTNDTPPGP